MTITTPRNPAAVEAAARDLLTDLPALCGPLGDLNRDAVCARAGRLYSLNVWLDNVLADCTRLPRLRNPRRAAALTEFISTDRADQVDQWRTWVEAGWLGECTHPADQRQELTLADALPGCSC